MDSEDGQYLISVGGSLDFVKEAVIDWLAENFPNLKVTEVEGPVVKPNVYEPTVLCVGTSSEVREKLKTYRELRKAKLAHDNKS